jgi:hypothetical protein
MAAPKFVLLYVLGLGGKLVWRQTHFLIIYIYIYTMNILLSRNNRFLSEYSGKLMSKLKTKVYYVRKIVVLK